MKCNYCANYMGELERCKYCSFEYSEEYTRDDWDILDLDEELEWNHLQILYRLWAEDVECLFADIFNDDVAFLVGCNADSWKIAEVLGLHQECVYNDFTHQLIILNLFQEKCMRNGCENAVL